MSNKESKTRIEEFRERLNREELERLWELEALDRIFTETQGHPEKFHQEWIRPLIANGLTLDSALVLVVQAHFHPD
jgi:hypothetical protein